MKKLAFALMFVSSIAGAACQGPYCFDDTGVASIQGAVALIAKPIATLNTITPYTTGVMLACSDCVQTPICVSSGTTAGAWVAVSVSSGSTANKFGACR